MTARKKPPADTSWIEMEDLGWSAWTMWAFAGGFLAALAAAAAYCWAVTS